MRTVSHEESLFFYVYMELWLEEKGGGSSEEGWGCIGSQTVVCILYILIWNDCF